MYEAVNTASAGFVERGEKLANTCVNPPVLPTMYRKGWKPIPEPHGIKG